MFMFMRLIQDTYQLIQVVCRIHTCPVVYDARHPMYDVFHDTSVVYFLKLEANKDAFIDLFSTPKIRFSAKVAFPKIRFLLRSCF